jgi:hypothetical protein
MNRIGLSPEVFRLCTEHVNSLEKLEILAALDRQADKQLARVALAESLQLPGDLLKQCLNELEHSGLVALTAEHLVRLNKLDATPALVELLQVYSDDRLAVMRALSDIAMERIRGMAARAFSSAFIMRKQRKEEDDDG